MLGLKKNLLAAAIMAFVAGAAESATIVQDFSFGPGSTPRATATFAQYGGPGTLSGVSLILSGAVESQLTGTADPRAIGVGRVARLSGEVRDENFFFFISPALFSIRVPLPTYVYTPVSTTTAGALLETDVYTANTTVNVPGLDPADFVGVGEIDVGLSVSFLSETTGGLIRYGLRNRIELAGLDFLGSIRDYTFSASLTYHVEPAVEPPMPAPIPLPASAWLMVCAFAGFGLLRRRRSTA